MWGNRRDLPQSSAERIGFGDELIVIFRVHELRAAVPATVALEKARGFNVQLLSVPKGTKP